MDFAKQKTDEDEKGLVLAKHYAYDFFIGLARGLTPHRGVIQDPRAASLPRLSAKMNDSKSTNGRFERLAAPLRV